MPIGAGLPRQNIPHDIKYQIPARAEASSSSGRPFGGLCLPQRSANIHRSMLVFVFVAILHSPFFNIPTIRSKVISEADLYIKSWTDPQ